MTTIRAFYRSRLFPGNRSRRTYEYRPGALPVLAERRGLTVDRIRRDLDRGPTRRRRLCPRRARGTSYVARRRFREHRRFPVPRRSPAGAGAISVLRAARRSSLTSPGPGREVGR